jgi:predicted glutamine amidotransferase
MCRLFGIISRAPIDPAYPVLNASQSLLLQSHVSPKSKQGDGWGIGWIESGQPRILKSPRPIYRDRARLRAAIHKPEGDILLGHVRWASNPLKLPRHELIGLAHTQPFQHGRWLFIHNGTLYIPREVKAKLGAWSRYVKGRNDSEVLFYWLLKTVVHGLGQSWPVKIRSSFRQLDRIWQSCKKRYPIYKHPYHGVNWVLTNGRVFLAFCYVDPRGFDKAKALCDPRQPYYQLQVKQDNNQVVVASEPLDNTPGWKPLGHGRLLVAEKNGSRIRTKILKVM